VVIFNTDKETSYKVPTASASSQRDYLGPLTIGYPSTAGHEVIKIASKFGKQTERLTKLPTIEQPSTAGHDVIKIASKFGKPADRLTGTTNNGSSGALLYTMS